MLASLRAAKTDESLRCSFRSQRAREWSSLDASLSRRSNVIIACACRRTRGSRPTRSVGLSLCHFATCWSQRRSRCGASCGRSRRSRLLANGLARHGRMPVQYPELRGSLLACAQSPRRVLQLDRGRTRARTRDQTLTRNSHHNPARPTPGIGPHAAARSCSPGHTDDGSPRKQPLPPPPSPVSPCDAPIPCPASVQTVRTASNRQATANSTRLLHQFSGCRGGSARSGPTPATTPTSTAYSSKAKPDRSKKPAASAATSPATSTAYSNAGAPPTLDRA